MIKFRRTTILWLPILHAFCVFLVWFCDTQKDISLLPTLAWLAMAWAWLVWPLVFVANRNIPTIYLAASCLASAVFIFPTATTVWFVTSIYAFGFAP